MPTAGGPALPALLLERLLAWGGLYLALPADVLLCGDVGLKAVNAGTAFEVERFSSTPWVKKCLSSSTTSAVPSPC